MSLQAAVPTITACWAHPMPLSGVSCRVWCSCGMLQCLAPCLPASPVVAAVLREFLTGLCFRDPFIKLCFYPFPRCLWKGVRAGLPAARCCELLGIKQAGLACLLMGILVGIHAVA